ncbi:MAG: SRPBCC domain-containing protein [Phycisphaerales bacterium]|nr:MAG: SRPBCC domain-containing protein [Phycisphaerales bacterium]
MIKREEDGLWIEIEEVIASHHEVVFGCLTTAGGLSRWFPVAAKIDLRQGGTITFGWDAQFKRKTTVAILDYDAGGKIIWDWQVARRDQHAPVYWQVEPSVEQGSRVVMRQGPFREETESLLAMADEALTWQWLVCNLRVVLEASHDMRAVRPL